MDRRKNSWNIFAWEVVSTKQYLEQYTNKKLLELTPEQLCEDYQKTHSRECFCTMYLKMLGQINSYVTDKKYDKDGLDNNTKLSVALSALEESMLSFDATKKNKFITLFTPYLFRQFYALTKPYNKKKRITPGHIESLEQITTLFVGHTDDVNLNKAQFESGFSDEVKTFKNSSTTSDVSSIECLDFIDNLGLTDIQSKILKYVYLGYTNAEIEKKLDITYASLYYNRKCIANHCEEIGVRRMLLS